MEGFVMKLNQLINQYIGYRKALGEKFKTNEAVLKAFCRDMGTETPLKSVTEEMIHHFLYRKAGTITTGWFCKHTALLGLYRYAVSRNYVTKIPLPRNLPKRPQGIVPYIYTQPELKLIFDGALKYQKNKSHNDPCIVRMALILTYITGLRVHETLSITLNDIDMNNMVITIRQSKFYKSRLVPFNEEVRKVLDIFLRWRKVHQQSVAPESHLLINNHGKPLCADSLRDIFHRILKNAGIKRQDGSAFLPRLHDLRHTFAVTRLISWYRQGKDVQQLLPILSVYLGHKHLSHTSVYLSMTNDLLKEANIRFESFVKKQSNS